MPRRLISRHTFNIPVSPRLLVQSSAVYPCGFSAEPDWLGRVLSRTVKLYTLPPGHETIRLKRVVFPPIDRSKSSLRVHLGEMICLVRSQLNLTRFWVRNSKIPFRHDRAPYLAVNQWVTGMQGPHAFIGLESY